MNSLEQAAKALYSALQRLGNEERWIETLQEHLDKFAKELKEENGRLRVLIAKEVPELRHRIWSLEAAFCHDHVSNGRNDLCKTCGFDLRDLIHNWLEHADTRTYPHEL